MGSVRRGAAEDGRAPTEELSCYAVKRLLFDGSQKGEMRNDYWKMTTNFLCLRLSFSQGRSRQTPKYPTQYNARSSQH